MPQRNNVLCVYSPSMLQSEVQNEKKNGIPLTFPSNEMCRAIWIENPTKPNWPLVLRQMSSYGNVRNSLLHTIIYLF